MEGTPSSLHKWRDQLRDIDFWLNDIRYRRTEEYRELRGRILIKEKDPEGRIWAPPAGGNVVWNVGVGPMASFTRAISTIFHVILERFQPFDDVIKVDLKPTATAGEEALGPWGIMAVAVAKDLGLLDQEYYSLKEKLEKQQYYSYGRYGQQYYSFKEKLEKHVWNRIVPQINTRLSAQRLNDGTYRRTKEYDDLRVRISTVGGYVLWNVGVGPMASFTRAISTIFLEEYSQPEEYFGRFDHVIKVDLKPTAFNEAGEEEALGWGIRSIKFQLAVAVAKKLGLLLQYYNNQQYYSLKEDYDNQQYYSYGRYGGTIDLEEHVWFTIVPQINKRLSAQRYLLLVENLQWPLDLVSVTIDVGLPHPRWTKSIWLISTTSHDVYNKSKSKDHGVISIHEDDHVLLLTLSALSQAAEHIFNMIHQESKEYWHRIALRCFHYTMTIFAKHSQTVTVTSDELIHQWAAQGILPAPMCTCSSKSAYMHQVGRVILEAFQDYSLLQLPFSPAKNADEATKTAAHFFAYHDLIAQGITVDELSDNKNKWISFMGDHGWHVSREWLSQEETSGPSALILRGCSPQSLIFSKLNHFLPKVCFLRVLDLSYTPLKSLPASIGRLHNLRLLSLRGCHDLKTLFSSSTTSTTDSTMNTSSYSPLSTLCQLEILDMNGVPSSHLTQDMVDQKRNLIHLDMSYSEVTTFPHNFFQEMSNLEELILVNCSNLVELPHSMAALSSLTTLEVAGTQIRYFPQKIFEEMQKLQSLKLTDNKKLISLPQPISRAHGLIDLHSEGRESIMGEEIKLEGHPTLISFLLIGSPHIRRLSLRGCRRLESVEFKNLGALEELDLSGTAIKEFPADIPNLPQLRQLLLLGVPSLRRFPWHKLERLPDVFLLDQCAEGSGNHYDQVAQVCVSDSRFFYSFYDTAMGLVRDGRFFQSFYVRVAPCITNSKRLQDEEGMINSKLQEFVQKQSPYLDVYSSCNAEEIAVTSSITAPLRRTERHVEITGMQQSSYGLRYLLRVTKSISVTCDNSIRWFARLSSFDELEECELRWCHQMEVVFDYQAKLLKHLRKVLVCNLKSLVHFCSEYSSCAFSALEHLHIECCPRLEDLMPDKTTLPCLKTLDILFCYNLKTIFYGRGGTYQFPSLQRIHLQELPLLQHFHDEDATITAPMWKELHVRGCWSLRCLPRLQDQSETVKVNGERSWWGKLQWGSPLCHKSYQPKLPPEFASFDKRAQMSSYLR